MSKHTTPSPANERPTKASRASQKVLVLGCGLVTPPLLKYLTEAGFQLTVASRTLSKIEKVIANLNNIKGVAWDVEADGSFDVLDKLAAEHDLIISLLPYIYHVRAAKIALKHKRHFCTSSYVSDEMQTLDPVAKAAGVVMLNECGVDPGLDHMSAQRVIDEVHAKGGKVVSFYSICGGLPAPKHNNNPFGYKLSWSPRGVLLAGRNDALFLRQGEQVAVPGKMLYDRSVYRMDTVKEVGELEWYPNRDSVKYRDIYGIPEVKTIIRGTYRYPSWSDAMLKIAEFGFNSTDEMKLDGKSYADMTAQLFGVPNDANLKTAAAAKMQVPVDGPVMEKFVWIGLFTDTKIPAGTTTPLDAVCALFEEKLVYAEGEQDMIAMQHTFEVEYPNGVRQAMTSSMVNIGLQPEGASSMSRTVSLPLAVGVRLILDGHIKATGIQRPITPEWYNPILNEMDSIGISFTETILPTQIWVRDEVKPGEERVGLTPSNAKRMLDEGFRVHVERSKNRCISDEEYEKVGCVMEPAGSWVRAPHDAIIFGLKELPEVNDPLIHRHVFFAHCFKNQGGWKDILQRFAKGNGLLWDLEFLVDDNGRRVAAFGRPAGIVGMAVGLLAWAAQKTGLKVPALSSWKSADLMVQDVKARLEEAKAKGAGSPSALVLGALGRSGKGAVWFAEQCGIKPTQWDLEETKVGGPFKELLNHDVLVNCIYLSSKIPPFVTQEMLEGPRKLSVLADVSCDTSNPNNPFPFYNQGTTLFDPVLPIKAGDKPMDVVAIDHLPSLIPKEASESFSDALTPFLLQLNKPQDHAVWQRAETLFKQKLAAALE